MKSNIEWTDRTWNPLAGCTWESDGCDGCYAAGMSLRLEAMAEKLIAEGKNAGKLEKYVGIAQRRSDGRAAFNGKIHLDDDALGEPLTWKKPQMVFVNSMSDLFHRDVPDAFLDRIFMVMREAKQHTFQVLTKRPERMKEYINKRWIGLGLFEARNIWLGTSVENQAAADGRLGHLVNTRAHVRFVSCEPLLGPVDLRHWLQAIHWVIVGGESGKGARPMHPDWARGLRDQCQEEGTKYFFKQHGEWAPCTHFAIAEGTDRNNVHQFEDGQLMYRYGKKQAGRLLDGREWNEMPAPP